MRISMMRPWGERASKPVLGLVSLGLAAVVLLTACGGGEPQLTPLPSAGEAEGAAVDSPTPSPTSGAYFAPEPTSEAQAIADATRAYEFYLATVAEVYAHPADSALIDEIARAGAAADAHKVAEVFAETSSVVSFADEFELDRSSSLVVFMRYEDGSTIPFGSATLFGCLDASAREGVSGDGKPVVFPDQRRVQVRVLAGYDVSAGRWYIYEEEVQFKDAQVVEC